MKNKVKFSHLLLIILTLSFMNISFAKEKKVSGSMCSAKEGIEQSKIKTTGYGALYAYDPEKIGQSLWVSCPLVKGVTQEEHLLYVSVLINHPENRTTKCCVAGRGFKACTNISGTGLIETRFELPARFSSIDSSLYCGLMRGNSSSGVKGPSHLLTYQWNEF